jgi:hypothetical protein
MTKITRPATLSVLSESIERAQLPCVFVNFTSRNLIVHTDTRITPSSPVTVEYEDVLFLGEVSQSVLEDGYYSHEVRVQERLTGLQSLLRLRSALLGTESREHALSSREVSRPFRRL